MEKQVSRFLRVLKRRNVVEPLSLGNGRYDNRCGWWLQGLVWLKPQTFNFHQVGLETRRRPYQKGSSLVPLRSLYLKLLQFSVEIEWTLVALGRFFRKIGKSKTPQNWGRRGGNSKAHSASHLHITHDLY
jgi:hypothetical protein